MTNDLDFYYFVVVVGGGGGSSDSGGSSSDSVCVSISFLGKNIFSCVFIRIVNVLTLRFSF